MDLDPEEARLLRAVGERPDDDPIRLVYADWLEERGATGRAEFLRAQLAMTRLDSDDPSFPDVAQALQRALPATDAAWRAAVAQRPLENCTVSTRAALLGPTPEASAPVDVRFVVRCPARWERLGLTDDPTVRRCSACDKDVHYCKSEDELRSRAWSGACVVVDVAVPRFPGDLAPVQVPMPGMFMPPSTKEPVPPPPAPPSLWARLRKRLGV